MSGPMTESCPVAPAALRSDPWRVHSARIVRRIDEAEGVITLELELADPTARRDYTFAPGQFNMLYAFGVGEAAISIASDPAVPERVGHTIRMVGQATNALGREKEGDVIGLRGPFGSRWPLEEARGKNLVLVAGGIGLPPLVPVIEEALRRRADYGRVVVCYGAKTVSDLLFAPQYERWRAGGIEVLATVDRADEKWRGERGLVPSLIRKLSLRGAGSVVLTCGPEIMMKSVVQESLDREIPEDQIFVSMERNMKCAVAFCGHCQLGPEFVCKDGPIFSYGKIKRWLGREGF